MVSLPSYDNDKFAAGICGRRLRRLPRRPGPAAAQPRHQRHLPAGVDLQAGDRPRRPGGGRHDRRRSAGRPTAATRSPARPAGSASSTGTTRVRAAQHRRRVRQELRHLLLPDGRRARHRSAGEWAEELGFGAAERRPAPGGGAPGRSPARRGRGSRAAPDVFTGELAQAGIGQNAIAVTPLQLLNAYAAVANGGHLMRPMIVRGETDADGNLVREYAPEVTRELAADPATCRRCGSAPARSSPPGTPTTSASSSCPARCRARPAPPSSGAHAPEGTLPFHSWFVAYLPSRAGRDGRGPRDRDLHLLGGRARERVGRGREVLPPEVLRPRPGPAARPE